MAIFNDIDSTYLDFYSTEVMVRYLSTKGLRTLYL